MDLIFNAYFWLGLCLAFAGIEILIAPLGFLFLSLGAFSTAIFLQYLMNEPTSVYVLTVFAVSSVFWAAILWKPFKKLIKTEKDEEINDIIGQEAVVFNKPLVPGELGKVEWSGTYLRAKLADGEETIEPNKTVVIVDAEGITVTVKLK